MDSNKAYFECNIPKQTDAIVAGTKIKSVAITDAFAPSFVISDVSLVVEEFRLIMLIVQ